MSNWQRPVSPLACVLLIVALFLAGCNGGGGGGGGDSGKSITWFELVDPTPGTGDNFGRSVTILANGNVVVADPMDSSMFPYSGAVHLYNPVTQTLIASIYGDDANDRLGAGGITALANNNFVIASPFDNVAGVFRAGTVKLFNGSTGDPIGSTIAGDHDSDLLGGGSRGGVIALANNNFVIASPGDDVFNGVTNVVDAGSVKLFNGTTGAPIGSTIAGDQDYDSLGNGSVTALANNNFVIASPNDDMAGVVDAGSVKLFNGSTGAPIGSTIAGNNPNDLLGSGVMALANNNFVIVSYGDDVAGVADAGSVKLFNGTTGAPIGSTIAGDHDGDSLGSGGVAALANNNFVIASPSDDIYNGTINVVDAGSVKLFNGSTGAPIGSTIAGDHDSDKLGGGGVIALANNNFVIVSPSDDVAGVADAGSVKLFNGTTGAPIGSAIAGDHITDSLGLGGVAALANNNFVIASPYDDVLIGMTRLANTGSVMLVSGNTGAPIGSTIVGDDANDRLGFEGITTLANSNFVIASPHDIVTGMVDAGSVMLVNGSTGDPIGGTIAGDDPNDLLGRGSITALANNNFVIASFRDIETGVVDAGSVMLVNGSTGALVGSAIVGTYSGDVFAANIVGSATGDFFVLALPYADNNGVVDSGLVRLIAQ